VYLNRDQHRILLHTTIGLFRRNPMTRLSLVQRPTMDLMGNMLEDSKCIKINDNSLKDQIRGTVLLGEELLNYRRPALQPLKSQ